MISQSTLGVLSFDPGQIENRYEMAAIFGILTFEILKVFDEILLAVSGASIDGVLIKFGKRIVVVVIVG